MQLQSGKKSGKIKQHRDARRFKSIFKIGYRAVFKHSIRTVRTLAILMLM